MKSEAKQLNYREIDNNKQDFLVNSDSNTKLAFLIVNILSVPFGLLLINSIYTNVGYIFVFSYMLIFSWIYRKSLRRLRKPFFWIQLVFIVLLSSIFWKDDTGAFGIFKPEGAIAGIEILIRALFIVIAFSGISVELKNKRVEKFLLSLGMGLFYRSISVAFGALPAMITMLPRSKQIIRHPIRSILLPLASADLWLEYFNTEFEKKSSTS